MKLWLLKPIEGRPEWKPWYDKAFGFVVRAENEADARALAAGQAGDEKDYGVQGRNPWLDAAASTCVELTKKGQAEVILRDFASA